MKTVIIPADPFQQISPFDGARLVDEFREVADKTSLPETLYLDQDGYPNPVAATGRVLGPWGKPGIVTILPSRYFVR